MSTLLGTYPIRTSETEESNLEGLDHVRMEVVATSSAQYHVGQAMPDYPGHVITSLQRRRNAATHMFTCVSEGITSGKGSINVAGYPQEVSDLEGWDTVTLCVETSNRNEYRKGQRLPGYSLMVCTQVSVSAIDRNRTRWRVMAHGKGIIASVNPWRETEGTNMRSFQHEAIRVPLSGGWNDARKADIAWPQMTKTVSYLSAQRPEFRPGTSNQVPVNPPAVWNPQLSGPVESFTWQWPNGWTLMGLTYEPLPGTTIGFVQLHYEYRPKLRFN